MCNSVGWFLHDTVIGVAFANPMLGVILTGIIISRGANYVSDFVKRLQGVKKE